MKKIISFILCLFFISGLSSCNEASSVLKTEKIIAVEYGSANEKACQEYISDGFTKVTYNTSYDVVLAVENMKADFGILDDFELFSFSSAERKIKEKDVCEYSIDYCAYFSLENEALQKSFNEAIRDLKSDGTLEKIIKTNFSGKSFFNSKTNNKNGTLTMLCDPNFDNRVFADDNGEIVGLDVDIAREICNYLGFDLEIVIADSDDLFTKLQDGEGDFIISACEVNEEREDYYLLSDAYFTLNYHLIERE